MRLQLDVSDETWNAPGGLGQFSAFIQSIQTAVKNNINVTAIVYDPGGHCKPRADELMDAPLLNNVLVTCYYQTTLNIPLGLMADLTGRGRIYAPIDNWWNLRVDAAPLDPNSEAIKTFVRNLGNSGKLHPDFNVDYGFSYTSVPANARLFSVTFSNTAESDRGAPGLPAGYPIPVEAQTNLRYIENNGRTDGDRHMLMFCVETGLVYELSYVGWDGTKWNAGYGAVFDVNSNYRRPEGWTSTDAAGLCVLPGLIRPDEVYDTDAPIKHALRCSFHQINNHVWPASHTGSTDAGAPPLGTRIRLKASKDISGYATPVRKVLQALKTYGGITADRGGTYVMFQGMMSDRFDPAVWNPAFHGLTIMDFDVIKLGWKP